MAWLFRLCRLGQVSDPGEPSSTASAGLSVRTLLLGSLLLWVPILVPAPAGAEQTLQISGVVSDQEGRPIAGALVLLEPLADDFASRVQRLEAPRPTLARSTTGPTGHYTVTAPGLGLYRVRITAPGYGVRFCDLAPLDRDTGLPSVELPPATEATLTLESVAASSLDGWIELDPVVPERFAPTVREHELRWRPTGPRGSLGQPLFVETGVDTWEVFLRVPGRAPHRQLWTVGEALRLASEQPIQVDVFDAEGVAVAGGLLELSEMLWIDRELWKRRATVPLARTDSRGRSLLEIPRRCLEGKPPKRPLPDDPAVLFALRCWLVAWSPAGERFEHGLRPSEAGESEAWTVTMDPPPSAWWAGKVVDAEEGTPLADALVWDESREDPRVVRSDPRGSYRWPVQSQGMSLMAAAPGYQRGAVRLQWPKRDPGQPVVPLFGKPENRLSPVDKATVEGWVFDPSGAPLAGAELLVREGYRPTDGWLRIAESNAEGRVLWTEAPKNRTLLLRAALDGYRAMDLQLGPLAGGERRDRVEWTLEPLRLGFGHVEDVDRQPIVGATVEWIDPRREAELEQTYSSLERTAVLGSTTTDPAGRFDLAELVAGTFDLEARAPGHAPLRVRGVEIPAVDGPIDLGTLVMARGHVIEGRVIEPDGTPVAEASVWVLDPEARGRHRLRDDEAVPDTVTDAEGRFALGERPGGERLQLEVESPDHVTRRTAPQVLPGEAPVELVLPRAATVAGVVFAPNGEPVYGATVSLEPETKESAGSELQWPTSVWTEADGTFEFLGVPAGVVALEADDSAHRPTRLTEVEVPEGVRIDGLRLVLEEGASLAGRVLDQHGSPLARVSVRVHEPRDNRTHVTSANTDADGAYRHEGLATGHQRVEIRAPSGEEQSRLLEIGPGENAADWRLEILEGVEVTGRTVAADGSIVPGVWVHLRAVSKGSGVRQKGDQARSDATGAFRFDKVAAGTYTVWASEGLLAKPGDQRLEVAELPLRDLEVLVDPGVTLTGRVLGLDPEDLARVTVSSDLSQDPVRLDHQGVYRLTGLPAIDREMTVTATLGVGERSARGRINLSSTGSEAELDLDFAAGTTLTGRVTAEGQAMAGMTVGCFDVGGRSPCGKQITSSTGHFDFPGLEPGPYQLGVLGPDQTLILHRSVHFEGEEIELVLGTGTLAGRVLGPDASPTTAEVYLEWQGPDATGARRVVSDADGWFRFDWVQAGPWQLRATSRGLSPALERLELAAGASREGIELRLGTGSALELEIWGGGQRLAQRLDLVFLDGDGTVVQRVSAVSDSTGRARVEGVPPGQWRMVVQPSGAWAQHQTSVEVPGDVTPIALQPAGGLQIVAPPQLDPKAELSIELVGPDGRSYYAFGRAPHQRWTVPRPTAYAGRLAPGPWTLRWEATSGESGEQQVVVQGGEMVVVALE